MNMSKAIIYSLSAMSLGEGLLSAPLAIRTVTPINKNQKQSFKQNRRKELTASRKKRNKQF